MSQTSARSRSRSREREPGSQSGGRDRLTRSLQPFQPGKLGEFHTPITFKIRRINENKQEAVWIIKGTRLLITKEDLDLVVAKYFEETEGRKTAADIVTDINGIIMEGTTLAQLMLAAAKNDAVIDMYAIDYMMKLLNRTLDDDIKVQMLQTVCENNLIDPLRYLIASNRRRDADQLTMFSLFPKNVSLSLKAPIGYLELFDNKKVILEQPYPRLVFVYTKAMTNYVIQDNLSPLAKQDIYFKSLAVIAAKGLKKNAEMLIKVFEANQEYDLDPLLEKYEKEILDVVPQDKLRIWKAMFRRLFGNYEGSAWYVGE